MSRFLSRISHELRTPLNAIIGFSRLLREAGGDQARARHVSVIQQSAEHLLQLVNDLLDLSRVEAGQISLTEQAVDLASQVRRALDIVEGRAEARQIGLQQQIPGGLPAARGDAGRILQVLINLLDNAVKFSPSQSTVTVSVERSGDDRLALQVRDQGPGIPAAFRAELFRPFSRHSAQTEADDDAGWVIIRDGEHAPAASAIPATSVLATLVRGTPAPEDTEPSAHRIIPTTAPVSNWRLALQEIVNERP